MNADLLGYNSKDRFPYDIGLIYLWTRVNTTKVFLLTKEILHIFFLFTDYVSHSFVTALIVTLFHFSSKPVKAKGEHS